LGENLFFEVEEVVAALGRLHLGSEPTEKRNTNEAMAQATSR
jgi:hypothetical protein